MQGFKSAELGACFSKRAKLLVQSRDNADEVNGREMHTLSLIVHSPLDVHVSSALVVGEVIDIALAKGREVIVMARAPIVVGQASAGEGQRFGR